LELVCKTQEGLVLAKEKTDLDNKVNILEKKMGEREEEMAYKETEFSKSINTLKDDATQSYIVGFEAVMEQAALVHPSMNFF